MTALSRSLFFAAYGTYLINCIYDLNAHFKIKQTMKYKLIFILIFSVSIDLKAQSDLKLP